MIPWVSCQIFLESNPRTIHNSPSWEWSFGELPVQHGLRTEGCLFQIFISIYFNQNWDDDSPRNIFSRGGVEATPTRRSWSWEVRDGDWSDWLEPLKTSGFSDWPATQSWIEKMNTWGTYHPKHPGNTLFGMKTMKMTSHFCVSIATIKTTDIQILPLW